MENATRYFFRNDENTFLIKFLSYISLGLFLSPWSKGFIFIIISIILWEIIFYLGTKGEAPHWRLHERIVLNVSYLLSYFLGRMLIDSPMIH